MKNESKINPPVSILTASMTGSHLHWSQWRLPVGQKGDSKRLVQFSLSHSNSIKSIIFPKQPEWTSSKMLACRLMGWGIESNR